MAWLATVCEAVARGVTRGILQEMRRQREVHPEEATDEELMRARRFAVAARRVLAERRERAGSEDPASPDAASLGGDRGAGA